MDKGIDLQQLAAGREGENCEAGLGIRASEGLNRGQRDQYVANPSQKFHEEGLAHVGSNLRFDRKHVSSLTGRA